MLVPHPTTSTVGQDVAKSKGQDVAVLQGVLRYFCF
jgi:hypothetical protein